MRWNVKNEKIANNENILNILLENRGVENNFLKNYSPHDLSDPYEIYDMDKAVVRIVHAIDHNEKIYIHGDFDVDGTAATATLWSYLYREKKADVNPYIPHRVDEGYGMSKKTIDKLIKDGAKLIISVDCGIKDIELTEYAKSQGVDVIISDHHEFVHNENGEPVLPDTIVIHGMHPLAENKRIFCGGVTAWKIACALEKHYTGQTYTDVTLSFLDMAAITTLSDIMPLKDENRVIVSLGLESMRQKRRVGVDELCQISQIDPKTLDTYHIGFVIGPRLNAPGRVENSAMNSLRILCTESRIKAKELAQHLDELNKKRQLWTEKYMDEVKSQIEIDEKGNAKSKVIFAKGVDWPEGIVGLVAGKIAEKYYRPTFVMSHNIKEDKVTGSARSIKNFHLVKALDECKDDLTRYGGHYMAAGFSLRPEKISDFKASVTKVAEKILTDQDIIPELNIDCYLENSALDIDTVSQIQKLSPFGYGNTTPVFAIKNAKLISTRLMGNNSQHVKHTWNVNGSIVDGIAFNCSDDWKEFDTNKTYDLAFNMDINEWNGRKTIQLMMKDIKEN